MMFDLCAGLISSGRGTEPLSQVWCLVQKHHLRLVSIVPVYLNQNPRPEGFKPYDWLE